MTRVFKYFPKKAARRFFTHQLLSVIIILLSVVLSLRYFVGQKINTSNREVILATQIDFFMVRLSFLAFGLAVLYTILTFKKFFTPLGRMVAKARLIKKGSYKDSQWEEYKTGEDLGEWYELDLSLNKINRQMKKLKQDGDQKQIELEALAGAVSDGVIAVDSEKEVRYFNGNMALILGKEFDPLSPPAFLDEVFRAPKLTLAVDKVIESGQKEHLQIQMKPHKSLESHIYDVVVSPVKLEKKSKKFGAISVFNDITEFKKTEEMRIDFVANASHELRTPLTSIKGFTAALEKDLQAGESKMALDKMEVINKNVSRLNNLVKDLLELSKIDSADEAVKEDVSVEMITDETLRELRQQIQYKNHQVSTSFGVQTVKANAIMLGQILSNLSENAVKYCAPGAQIHIEWLEVDEHVVLRVHDNGDGVSSEHLSRLFERFYRVQGGKTRSGVLGTGLGLSIVKNCMLKHRGRVDVDSLPGRGTTFSCFFPKG